MSPVPDTASSIRTAVAVVTRLQHDRAHQIRELEPLAIDVEHVVVRPRTRQVVQTE